VIERTIIGAVVAYMAAIMLLDGPLRSMVPSCDQIVLGFCLRESR
jgi:hypothetical protein